MEEEKLNRLRQIRIARGMNQAEFGRVLEIAQNTYSQIETGKIPLKSKLVSQICFKFAVNEEWLYSGKGDMFIGQPNPRDKDGLTAEEKELLCLYQESAPEVKKEFLNYAHYLLEKQNSTVEPPPARADMSRKPG
jgi:transcriptional regulator with XRE-family HTH domain